MDFHSRRLKPKVNFRTNKCLSKETVSLSSHCDDLICSRSRTRVSLSTYLCTSEFEGVEEENSAIFWSSTSSKATSKPLHGHTANVLHALVTSKRKEEEKKQLLMLIQPSGRIYRWVQHSLIPIKHSTWHHNTQEWSWRLKSWKSGAETGQQFKAITSKSIWFRHLGSLTQPHGCGIMSPSPLLAEAQLTANVSKSLEAHRFDLRQR